MSAASCAGLGRSYAGRSPSEPATASRRFAPPFLSATSYAALGRSYAGRSPSEPATASRRFAPPSWQCCTYCPSAAAKGRVKGNSVSLAGAGQRPAGSGRSPGCASRRQAESPWSERKKAREKRQPLRISATPQSTLRPSHGLKAACWVRGGTVKCARR